MDKFDDLILNNIFKNLSILDVFSCLLVCKKWYISLNKPFVWEILLNKNYPKSIGIIGNPTKLTFRKCMAIDKFKQIVGFYNHSINDIYKMEEFAFDIRCFEKVFNVFPMLTNLKEIDFTEQYITVISKQISFLTDLESLDFSYNRLKNIPAELCTLTNLRHLSFNTNQITNIPTEISKLTNLELLDLSHNGIHEIPIGLSKLTNLKYLNLGYNILDSSITTVQELQKNGCMLYIN